MNAAVKVIGLDIPKNVFVAVGRDLHLSKLEYWGLGRSGALFGRVRVSLTWQELRIFDGNRPTKCVP